MPSIQTYLFEEDRLAAKIQAEHERRERTFGTPEFRAAYNRYLKSARWRDLANARRAIAKGRCERCGRLSSRLEVHHHDYTRFGRETLAELKALCVGCHDDADEERRRRNRAKAQAAREDARYERARATYFEKVLGENWMEIVAHDDRWDQQFEEWLERKEASEH